MNKLALITVISNKKRTLRLNFKPSEEVLKNIDSIFLNFSKLSLFEWYDNEYEHRISYNPSEWKEFTIPFFQDEESGFIIIKEKSIEIILLKSSKLFRELKRRLFDIFTFVEYNPKK